MTSLGQRMEISASLRGVGMSQSVTSDLEGNPASAALPTTGWFRSWDEAKSEYIWKNQMINYSSNQNPFAYEQLDQIPAEFRDSWISVIDEREHRILYVNPSLKQEQWNQPLEQTDETERKSQRTIKVCHMDEYAANHFNLSRGWLHSKLDVRQALSFSEERLQQPLLNVESKFTHMALMINEFIWSYTKPKRGETSPQKYIQQLIALIMMSPPILLDECYCQTLKQMTGCNTQQIVDRSWHILIVLVSSFLPSNDLLPYVEYFIRTSNNTLSHELMERCNRNLEICKKVGDRKEPPTIEEIDMLLSDTCRQISVHILPDSELPIEISMLAQSKDVIEQINQELKLGKSGRMFQLFRVRDSTRTDEVLLNENSRMTDILSTMKEGEYILFAVAYYDFSYDLRNAKLLRLLFCQAVHDLHAGRYFKPDEDYFTLTALALQESLQDYSGDNRVVCDAIAKLLPPHLSIPARKLVCEAEVLKVYNKLRGYTSQECMITLLDYISSWEDYGVTHFYGDQFAPEKQKGKIIGISPRGVHIGDYANHLGRDAYTQFYPYSAISAWGLSENSLSFYLATKPGQQHYQFVMQHTDAAYNLIQHYSQWNVCCK